MKHCLHILVVSAVLVGCRPTSLPKLAQETNSPIQAREEQFDRTVWRAEVLAQSYERTFVALADQIRTNEDKLAVLAALPFESLQVPKPMGKPKQHILGLEEQAFDSREMLTLSHVGWEARLAQLRQAGWRIFQSEWHHEKFVSSPPRSEFSFEIDGEQGASNRFILRGTLLVGWRESHEEIKQPAALSVTNLVLIERSGIPGFSHHLAVAPQPADPRGEVNIHPLIVSDLNDDGHADIILPGVNQVLWNDGHAQFRTEPLILEENFTAPNEVGLIADFDGDGKLDFLTVSGSGSLAKMLILYRGDGAVPFRAAPIRAWPEQQTAFAAYKLDAPSVLTTGDIDGDGDLDLFVAQYKPPYVGGQLPTPYYDANDGYPSFLLLNDGHGSFQVAPPQPALSAKKNRRTLAASLVDLDSDGDLDLVTLNDFSGVDLFYNDGKGRFTDETARLDNHYLFGMAHAFADFNRDGRLDLLAIGMSIPTVRRLDAMKAGRSDMADRTAHRSEMAYGNRLYLNQGAGERWAEPPFAETLARTGWSWGVAASDFDNNGSVDVYIANGHVSGGSSADYDSQYWTHDIYSGSSKDDLEMQRYFNRTLNGLNRGKTSWNGYQHNALFLDLETNKYLNVAFLIDLAHEVDCRAVVSADLNEDGRPDLLVTAAKWQGSPNLMRHELYVHLNQLEASNHWIGVRLSARNGSPIGAKVWLSTEERTYAAQVVTGESFQSQRPNEIHFGLGKISRAKELRVVWSNGKTNVLTNPEVDRYHRFP